jgi:DNA/RNA endonuclease YhcR with UshA esterase domain
MRRITAEIQVEKYAEAVETDRYGNPVPGYAAPVSVGVYAVAPKQSTEPDELGRRAVITGLTVYAPLETDVGPHDRVTYRGDVYEVQGVVGRWENNPHVHVNRHEGITFDLERSTG